VERQCTSCISPSHLVVVLARMLIVPPVGDKRFGSKPGGSEGDCESRQAGGIVADVPIMQEARMCGLGGLRVKTVAD
jgi:hypothetical protein